MRDLVDSLLAREHFIQNANRNRSGPMVMLSGTGIVISQLPEELIMHANPVGSFYVDSETRILESTPESEHLFEQEVSCAPGMELAQVLEPEVRDTLYSLMSTTAPFERRIANCSLCANGHARELMLSVSRLRVLKQPRSRPLFMVTFWDLPDSDSQQGEKSDEH